MTILLGFDQNVRCIASTKIVGPDGEALCLADMTTTKVIGAGVYLKDEGYVLGVKPEKGVVTTSYFALSAEEIGKFQAQALLPNPLPAYSIPLTAYLWGYSFWAFLALAVAWAHYSTRHLKRSPSDKGASERASRGGA